MVTQAIEMGIRPAPMTRGTNFLYKLVCVVSLGCCMDERHVKPITIVNTPTPLEEFKTDNTDWSTATLGIETDPLDLRPQAIHSDSSMPDTRRAPLSSFKYYPPASTSQLRAARPRSRSRRERRRGAESPIITITNHYTTTDTTPNTGECQRERGSKSEEG